MAYRAQPVCHDHHRLSLVELVQVLHDFLLVVRIQRIRRLVEEQELRVLIDRPGDEQALSLPLADAVALHTYFGIVT